jgi:two-component system, OmpR family, sensor histidine kinase ChvG
MQSKPSTASDIATSTHKPTRGTPLASTDDSARQSGGQSGGQSGRKAGRRVQRSPIARLILALNLAGLMVLVGGALVLNEMRAGLVLARAAALETQAELIASVLSDLATRGRPDPGIEADRARTLIKRLNLPPDVRLRLIDPVGEVVADSWLLSDRTVARPLAPLDRLQLNALLDEAARNFARSLEGLDPRAGNVGVPERTLAVELALAFQGDAVKSRRLDDQGGRVISVSAPVQRVSAVVAVVTIESSDVDEIVQAERLALLPFISVAVLVSLLSALALTLGIARPLRRLALAAEKVQAGTQSGIDLPQLAARRDEIGDLARAVQDMTETLNERIAVNERFAADVAHEIKNPLTSIRSAVETAERVSDPAILARLRAVIASDVGRLDRLITDISNATRLEAEAVREPGGPVMLDAMLADLVSIYAATRNEHAPRIALERRGDGPWQVVGREGPLVQAVRNLIENARSFSPADGEIVIALESRLSAEGRMIDIAIEDQGPGIPEDRLEAIFDRFYTDRPKGTDFGRNSGLGLSIVRQITRAHNGRVWAENRMDQTCAIVGARFVMELPDPSRRNRPLA